MIRLLSVKNCYFELLQVSKVYLHSSGVLHDLCPKVAQYRSYKVGSLKEGDVKFWCRCGLSNNQPWCDGSHKGTSFLPLKWTVPTSKMYGMCGCKYTKKPPLCDGQHREIKKDIEACQDGCRSKENHKASLKLCTECGWAPN